MNIVAALYKFTDLDNLSDLKAALQSLCAEQGVRGSLLLASEGINGTVAGSREAIDALKDFLLSDLRFHGLEYKESQSEKNPFRRMKVLLKKEIVTLGAPVKPKNLVGSYVNAEEWNKLLADEDVVVIDVRNDYEVDIGTFKNAINPKTKSFREFPRYVAEKLDPKKHKKIAMCCTGGIRCEKASSYMLELGFQEVYHLKGGILKYLQDTKQEASLWQGECFVFDHRVSVNHDLEPGTHAMCFGCGNPLSPSLMASDNYKKGVYCPNCFDKRSAEQIKGAEERQKQMNLAQKRAPNKQDLSLEL
jgi:UPF0176 protein